MRLRLPPTLLFGRGRLADLAPLLIEIGTGRPLVVTDPGVTAAGHTGSLLAACSDAGLPAEAWDGVASDPGPEHAEACRDRLLAGGHDAVVALGGGSVLDAAKVGAVLATNGGNTADIIGFDRVRRPGLPVLAVPTTPGSGAEVSSHAVLLAAGRKEVVAGLHLLPRAAVVDPLATLGLPPERTLWSALDALIHAVEALLARRATPWTDIFARLAVPAIARALPRVLQDGGDLAARDELCLGCLHSGLAMANANAGAIHALGYPLTGRHGVPHGLANALVAAAALERLAPAAPARSAELAVLLAGAEPALPVAGEMRRLLAALGLTDRLAAWGVRPDDLPSLADAATTFRPVLENAPMALGRDDLLAIYRDSWS